MLTQHIALVPETYGMNASEVIRVRIAIGAAPEILITLGDARAVTEHPIDVAQRPASIPPPFPSRRHTRWSLLRAATYVAGLTLAGVGMFAIVSNVHDRWREPPRVSAPQRIAEGPSAITAPPVIATSIAAARPIIATKPMDEAAEARRARRRAKRDAARSDNAAVSTGATRAVAADPLDGLLDTRL